MKITFGLSELLLALILLAFCIYMAELNLGIVRDSTLNSTNDFQIFGETFENVALIGPQQAAYWITATLCPNGEFPGTGTAIACS